MAADYSPAASDTGPRFAECAARARKLSDAHLDHWLRFHTERGNLVVAGAIRCEQARRRLAEQRDAELRKVFA